MEPRIATASLMITTMAMARAAVDDDDGPDLPPILRRDEQRPTQMGQRSDQDEDDHLGDNDLNDDIPF